MEPAAVLKAEALAAYGKGAKKSTLTLTLSDREAWEFLRWYRAQLSDPGYFDREMSKAEAFNDPWPMFEGLHINGFAVERMDEETH